MSVVRRHPVITFFLLAYALSWAAIRWKSFFAPSVLVATLMVMFPTVLTAIALSGAWAIRVSSEWPEVDRKLWIRRPGIGRLPRIGEPYRPSHAPDGAEA